MAFKHKERVLDSVIPTASMADVAFLLLIFFIVTTQFHLDRTNVTLPLSEIRNEVPKGAAYVVIYRSNETADFGYKFSDGEVQSRPVPDIGTMEIEINTLASMDSSKPVVIKAPGDAPYKFVDEIIAILRLAGVEEIVLLTDQLTSETPG